jgi:hypothetical protein
MLVIGASTFIFVMLLPALLELKRPRDAGPRRIMTDVHISQLYRKGVLPLANMEEDIRINKTLVKRIAKIITVLPNLET